MSVARVKEPAQKAWPCYLGKRCAYPDANLACEGRKFRKSLNSEGIHFSDNVLVCRGLLSDPGSVKT